MSCLWHMVPYTAPFCEPMLRNEGFTRKNFNTCVDGIAKTNVSEVFEAVKSFVGNTYCQQLLGIHDC